MQTQKDNVREQILTSAEKLFQEKGFLGVSMREIAAHSNIGLSNMYNYFKNKDDIFRTIVQPSVTALIQFNKNQHRAEDTETNMLGSQSHLENMITPLLSLITRNRSGYKLLFFKAQGSSLEQFKEEYIDASTAENRQYFDDMKKRYPHIKINISDFFIHLCIIGTFTLFEELLMHDIKKREIKQILTEHIKYHTAGWMELMKI